MSVNDRKETIDMCRAIDILELRTAAEGAKKQYSKQQKEQKQQKASEKKR